VEALYVWPKAPENLVTGFWKSAVQARIVHVGQREQHPDKIISSTVFRQHCSPRHQDFQPQSSRKPSLGPPIILKQEPFHASQIFLFYTESESAFGHFESAFSSC
jgi:hypothetical protein